MVDEEFDDIEEVFEDEEENALTRDEFFEVLERVSDVNEDEEQSVKAHRPFQGGADRDSVG